MRICDLTVVELQRLGRSALRAHLAHARRAPEQQQHRQPGGPPSSGVQPAHIDHATIGPVTVLRQGADRAYAAAAFSTGDPRSAALLACELATQDGRLRVTHIGDLSASIALDKANRWALDPAPPPHLVRLLGPLPAAAEARVCWATAAAIVNDYRDTWAITDPRLALGSQVGHAEQRTDRDRAVAATRHLINEIDLLEPRRAGLDRRSGGWDLDR